MKWLTGHTHIASVSLCLLWSAAIRVDNIKVFIAQKAARAQQRGWINYMISIYRYHMAALCAHRQTMLCVVDA